MLKLAMRFGDASELGQNPARTKIIIVFKRPT